MSYSTSRTQHNDKIDYLPRFDYPHHHNPTIFSEVAGLSTDVLRQLPTDLQDTLWLVQEAASVVYASHERLVDLVDAKFDRLILRRGKQQYNPATFENYTNQLIAKRRTPLFPRRCVPGLET